MFRPSLIASFALALATFAPSVHAEVSPVSLRVEQVSSSQPEKHATTQKRSLKIFLSNGTGQDQTGLKVKYYYFAKDVKDKDVMVKDSGEKSADVKARATEVIETPVVTATSTEAHQEGNGRQNRNGTFKGGKKVEASGDKIVGYGVQVFSGEKLLTEYFSAPSLKANVAGGAR